MTFLYMADPVRGAEWARHFARLAPEIDFRVGTPPADPATVRYVATWRLDGDRLSAYSNVEIVFCTGAGVDLVDMAAVPPRAKLVRMVEPGLVDGMVEYVTMAVLALHRDAFAYEAQQAARQWKALPVRPAVQSRVGVMGLGVLSRAVLARLAAFGYPCASWSRSPHAIEGIECHAGEAGLDAFLERTDILVCLLPLTDATRGILDRKLFARLLRGAAVINVGRGGHLVQEDLVASLDAGELSWAVLDVADPEPLPPHHPLWTHPRVRITPHIASETQVPTAVEAVVANLRRHRRGEPLVGLVDRSRGY